MSSDSQKKYIADLSVIKTKEFKEVKELLFSSGIVSPDSQVIRDAQTIAAITDALDNYQASKFIDTLIAKTEPNRSTTYSPNRVERTIGALEDIKKTIDKWSF